MFVKDGEGRGWLSWVWRASAGFYPVVRKGICCHTHRWSRKVAVTGWEEGVWLVSGNEESSWLWM